MSNRGTKARIIEELGNITDVVRYNRLQYVPTSLVVDILDRFLPDEPEPQPAPWVPKVRDVIHVGGGLAVVDKLLVGRRIHARYKNGDGVSVDLCSPDLCFASPEEEAEFYTVTGLHGERAICYRDGHVIRLYGNEGVRFVLVAEPVEGDDALFTNAMLAYFGLTADSHLIKPQKDGETFEPPRKVE